MNNMNYIHTVQEISNEIKIYGRNKVQKYLFRNYIKGLHSREKYGSFIFQTYIEKPPV